jgi:hypothetical protein
MIGRSGVMNQNHEYERIEDESAAFEKVDSREIESTLGANVQGFSVHRKGSPFAIAALRGSLFSELVSTGGRPGRREATETKKVPLTEFEWRTLDTITELIRGCGTKATSSQVAGLLLKKSMAEVMLQLEKVSPPSRLDAQMLQKIPDNVLAKRVEEILAAAASAEVHLESLRPVAEELLRRMRSGKGVEST